MSRGAQFLLFVVFWTLLRTRTRSAGSERLRDATKKVMRGALLRNQRPASGAPSGRSRGGRPGSTRLSSTRDLAYDRALEVRQPPVLGAVGAAPAHAPTLASQFVRKIRGILFDLGSGVFGLFVALIAVIAWCTTYPSMLTFVPLAWTLIVVCTSKLTRAFNAVLTFMILLVMVQASASARHLHPCPHPCVMCVFLCVRGACRRSTWCASLCPGST